MQQFSRQPATNDLHRPSSNPTVIQRPFLDCLCKKSKQLRSAMIAGGASLGLDFGCDGEEGYEAEPLEQLSWNLSDIEELWTAIMESFGTEHS